MQFYRIENGDENNGNDATVVEQKQLVKYEVDGGVAIIEMDDPPANTYTYEMMQQLDTLILKARMDESVHVIVLRGKRREIFLGGREHSDADAGRSHVQILFLPARQ